MRTTLSQSALSARIRRPYEEDGVCARRVRFFKAAPPKLTAGDTVRIGVGGETTKAETRIELVREFQVVRAV
jgi:hypothetical protein